MSDHIKTGGPAFPRPAGETSLGGNFEQDGMTLRDWFATHCPAEWLVENMPKTVGAIRDELIARGFIPPSSRNGDVLKSYNAAAVRKLNIALRWDYADAMIAAREVKTEGAEA